MSNAANFPILSLILFTPLAGAVLLLFVSKRQENLIRWIANIVAFLGFVVSVPLWFWYDPAGAQYQFIERVPVDPVHRGGVLPGRRRLQRAADPADHADGHDRGPVVLDGDQGAREGVRHLPPRAPGRHDRRVRLARLPAVLPVLGGHAGADVLPDRHLGQRPAAVLGDQVLPLHPGRQRGDAAGHPRAVLPLPRRRRGSTASTSRSTRR